MTQLIDSSARLTLASPIHAQLTPSWSPQADRAAAKRDAFLRKKASALGSAGSASGGESETASSSLQNTPRTEAPENDTEQRRAGGLAEQAAADAAGGNGDSPRTRMSSSQRRRSTPRGAGESSPRLPQVAPFEGDANDVRQVVRYA